jgi:glutathione S-transferase
MPLTFYFHPISPPARAVLSLLLLAKIPHQKVEINLNRKENRTTDFLKVCPLGTIPAIDDDGFFLGESEAIMKYLINSRKVGEEYYPLDPKKRALVDKYYPFQHGMFRPNLTKYFASYNPIARVNITQYPIPENPADAKPELLRMCGLFEEAFLKDTKYVAGDTMTIADFSAFNELSVIYYTTDYKFEEFSKIQEYFARCLENPVLKEINKPVQEFPEKMRQYYERKKARELKNATKL